MSEEKTVKFNMDEPKPVVLINGLPKKYALSAMISDEYNRVVKDKFFITIGYIENGKKEETQVWFESRNKWWMASNFCRSALSGERTLELKNFVLDKSYKYDKKFMKYLEENMDKVELYIDEDTLHNDKVDKEILKNLWGENNEKLDAIIAKAEKEAYEKASREREKREKKIEDSGSKNNSLFIVNHRNELVGLTSKGLKSIKENPHLVLPKGIKKIGKEAFKKLDIVSVEIPEGVTDIDEKAFYYCTELKTVKLPNSLTDIGKLGFACCPKLENLVLPNNLRRIGNEAFFKSCMYEWSNFKLPESVEIIGDNAFTHTAIRKIRLHKGLRKIGFNSLDCYLEEIEIEGSYEEFFKRCFMSHAVNDDSHIIKFTNIE